MLRVLTVMAIGALICQHALAAEAGDLYAAQAIVTGTEEPERTRGFRAGLTDIIIKLTGDARLKSSARLRPLLEHPHRFVKSFEYEDRMKGIPIHDEQGTRERPHYLRMRFKPAMLDAALRQLGLSKWPPDRPLLVIWLGVRTAHGAYVLRSAGPEGYGQRAVITETAVRRGIPIQLPPASGLAATITLDDIAADNLQKLEAASEQADALLTGVLAATPKGYWTIGWRLYWRGQLYGWALSDVTFDKALKNGLESSALFFSGNEPR